MEPPMSQVMSPTARRRHIFLLCSSRSSSFVNRRGNLLSQYIQFTVPTTSPQTEKRVGHTCCCDYVDRDPAHNDKTQSKKRPNIIIIVLGSVHRPILSPFFTIAQRLCWCKETAYLGLTNNRSIRGNSFSKYRPILVWMRIVVSLYTHSNGTTRCANSHLWPNAWTRHRVKQKGYYANLSHLLYKQSENYQRRAQRSAPYQTASMNQWAQPCVETKQQYRTLEIVISPPLLLLLFAVSLMSLKISPQNREPKT